MSKLQPSRTLKSAQKLPNAKGHTFLDSGYVYAPYFPVGALLPPAKIEDFEVLDEGKEEVKEST